MTLPELPEPDIVVTDTGDAWKYSTNREVEGTLFFTEDQLRQYGQLCADKERERWVSAEKEAALQFKIHKELLESMNDKLLEEIQRLREELYKGEV